MLSSVNTKRMIEELDVEPQEIFYSDIPITLELSPELCAVLETITDKRIFQRIKRTRVSAFRYQFRGRDYLYQFKSSLQQPRTVSIRSLIEMMEVLDANQLMIDQLPEKQIAAIEEYRVCMMRAVYAEIDKSGRKPARVRTILEEMGARFYLWLKTHWPAALAVGFGLLFIVGIALDLLYNFAGFYEILSLAPMIPAPVAIGICIALSLLNLILYVAFEGAMLGEMFDIRPKAAEKKKLDMWGKQIKLAKNIHERLVDDTVKKNVKEAGTLSTYKMFDKQCDRMVLRRQLSFGNKDCNETPARKRLRIALVCIGALLSIGSAFFSGISMLPMIPVIMPFLAAFMATPAGPIVFVGIVVLSMLAGYFAMQRKGITQLLSPNLDTKQKVAKQLNDYHDREPSELSVKPQYINGDYSSVKQQADVPVNKCVDKDREEIIILQDDQAPMCSSNQCVSRF